MPAALVYATPFEEEILDIFRHAAQRWDAHRYSRYGYPAYGIARWGKEEYGDNWGGSGRECRSMEYWKDYPLINLSLGLLKKKGLLERVQSVNPASNRSRHFGGWRLTEQGRDLLGLSPLGSS